MLRCLQRRQAQKFNKERKEAAADVGDIPTAVTSQQNVLSGAQNDGISADPLHW